MFRLTWSICSFAVCRNMISTMINNDFSSKTFFDNSFLIESSNAFESLTWEAQESCFVKSDFRNLTAVIKSWVNLMIRALLTEENSKRTMICHVCRVMVLFIYIKFLMTTWESRRRGWGGGWNKLVQPSSNYFLIINFFMFFLLTRCLFIVVWYQFLRISRINNYTPW